MIHKSEDAVEILRPLLQSNRLVLFIGSGVSVDPPSNLPLWDGLIREFIAFCADVPPELRDTEFEDLLESARQNPARYPERIASALIQKLQEIEDARYDIQKSLRQWMTERFNSASPNANHDAIVQTNYPFLITSNYDNLLEKASRSAGFSRLALRTYDFNQAPGLAIALYQREPCIIHAHGDAQSISVGDMIFTSEDYARIRRKYPGFRLALKAVMLQYSLLFVGYGGSDPHFEDLMEEMSHDLNWSVDPALPKTFIFMHEDKVDPILRKYKEARRAHFITIDDYSKTPLFLEQLRDIQPRQDNV
jgi:hypothetical protein